MYRATTAMFVVLFILALILLYVLWYTVFSATAKAYRKLRQPFFNEESHRIEVERHLTDIKKGQK